MAKLNPRTDGCSVPMQFLLEANRCVAISGGHLRDPLGVTAVVNGLGIKFVVSSKGSESTHLYCYADMSCCAQHLADQVPASTGEQGNFSVEAKYTSGVSIHSKRNCSRRINPRRQITIKFSRANV